MNQIWSMDQCSDLWFISVMLNGDSSLPQPQAWSIASYQRFSSQVSQTTKFPLRLQNCLWKQLPAVKKRSVAPTLSAS